MALVLRSLYGFYNFLFNEYKDPRVEDLPLLFSPVTVIAIILGYGYFVLAWGPRWMANRKAYDLTQIINVYNLVQVLVNLYIGIFALHHAYLSGELSIKCAPVNQSTTPDMMKVVFFTYLYYVMKLVDILDTVFFVLRKKNKQITFLHVYHHGGMVLGSYISLRFLAGSHGTFLGVLNSFVHSIMYGYYFLTSFKPELKYSLWWKKHITQLQLVQFAVIVLHFMGACVFFECAYPKALAFIGMTQNLFMFFMFLDFYFKAYIKQKN